ncbi:hypothetical protein B0T16DRAFT_496840 [Cercophora newfieldiana]|uniref:Uncharacterized protein n=1 Tax=Cercophora newfieldiana TaxID=92897 RepID=A0AA40CIB4_9PEZI|nr:hypothetical protein B0T16DRAFT_496840 [Cercophora newfieldiana]
MTTTTMARVIEGQLTTVFTPSGGACSMTRFFPYVDGARETAFLGFIAEKDWYCPPPGHQPEDFSRCIPTKTTSAAGNHLFHGPFSPGLHCPQGWHTAVTLRQAEQQYIISGAVVSGVAASALSASYPLSIVTAGETGAICCPRDYAFGPNIPMCIHDRSTGFLTGFLCWERSVMTATQTTVSLGSTSPAKTYTLVYTGFDTTSRPVPFTNTFVNPVAHVRAYPLMLLWHASDLSLSTTTSGVTGAVPTSSAPGGVAETVQGGEGLSTGAKIGIGVAAGVAGLLALALIAVVMYLRKQKKSARETAIEETAGGRQN